ncbi:TadE/TadG family type IV pilus assembly protein [Homoserinibacter sp. YIM 151385]|uniref:TadE/TadG family type IV pilus assembly protein n=1 Tax=Homoserinibacter sp. YIM 151385 TaxID=2985506 RepID=UPI0022F129D7|nr:TadE/TadG family type IV pilus assembly protein [Homoserinibacter sp. YIM 151385]WBU38201.1 TadE/TadG family type IV pilus assembly protein [Homoserinibacter sp. YIM 151385]
MSPASDPTGEAGSAVVEFVLVSALLTLLTLAVLQLALALHVRNTVQDAAAEGARAGALADARPGDGAARARELVIVGLGPGYEHRVESGRIAQGGRQVELVRIRAALPLAGLLGVDGGIEVVGRAPVESLD